MKLFLIMLLTATVLAAHGMPTDTGATGLKTGKIQYTQANGQLSPPQSISGDQVTIEATLTELKKFIFIYDLKSTNTLTANTTLGVFDGTKKSVTFEIGTNLLNTTVKLSEKDANGKEVEILSFKFKSASATVTSVAGTIWTQKQYQDYFNDKYKNLNFTDVGYKSKDDYYKIHIFLDQYGNSLFSSIPTGIQRKYHYILHILGDPVDGKSRFVVSQTGGTLNDNVASYNISGTIANSKDLLQGEAISGEQSKSKILGETQMEFPPTSDDMTFTVSQMTPDGKTNNLLRTYTIKKTSFYIGSFDIGIFKTWLSNPTFSSINSPTEDGKQALKTTNNTPYVTATLMYTVYFSLYSALVPEGKGGKRYNYWGRSFLDDEGCFLRKIYPAIGVGLGSNALSNWFFGLNYEPMQGFGLFAGRNVRKVNTFEAPSTLDFNNITTDQFNFYQNSKTKSEWAIGVLLDLSVFAKIIGTVSANK